MKVWYIFAKNKQKRKKKTKNLLMQAENLQNLFQGKYTCYDIKECAKVG